MIQMYLFINIIPRGRVQGEGLEINNCWAPIMYQIIYIYVFIDSLKYSPLYTQGLVYSSFLLWVEKLRLREVKWVAQGPRARNWWGWIWNLGLQRQYSLSSSHHITYPNLQVRVVFWDWGGGSPTFQSEGRLGKRLRSSNKMLWSKFWTMASVSSNYGVKVEAKANLSKVLLWQLFCL